MGGFIYSDKRRNGGQGHPSSDLDAARRVFEVKGLPLKHRFETDAFTIDLFDKHAHPAENYTTGPGGEFALATGSLVYRDRIGKEALDLLLRDFPTSDLLSNCRGHFFALVFKGGRLSAFGDYQGLYHVFSNSDQSIVSNSFLAIAKTLPSRSVSRHEIYEMILYGATYGRPTLLEGVELLGSRRLYELGSGGVPSELAIETEPATNDIESRVQQVAESLTGYFRALKPLFGSEICAALSGGFDSRLLLAAMRQAGVEPQLYVYGPPGSADVRLAIALCEGEGLEIEHIDRGAFPKIEVDEWEESLRDTFYFFDGKGDNAVDSGSDLETRRRRSSGARLQLNGGGGEVFRNFWKLPEGSYSVERFVQARRGTIDTRLLTDVFDERAFFSALVGKHRDAIELAEGERPERDRIEMLYPRLRMRHWMGQNNSANSQHSYALTPLAEPIFTIPSASIPIPDKNLGQFEAAVIKQIDPALSRYPSAHGFDFSGPPGPIPRLKNWMTLHVPIGLRGPIRQVRQRYLSRSKWPFYLQGEYYERIFGKGPLEVSRYIDVEGIRNVGLLKRVMALELLLTDRF